MEHSVWVPSGRRLGKKTGVNGADKRQDSRERLVRRLLAMQSLVLLVTFRFEFQLRRALYERKRERE
jgi:hypothetical protein